MTFCDMHKPSGCGECPNRYVCKSREFKVGETWEGEKITRVSKVESVLVTNSYNKVSCRWETNFYDIETLNHKFTKVLR